MADRRDLEERTKVFALKLIEFISALPNNQVTRVIGNQLLRSGTSIGANCREASRAASRRDFVHKISLVEKEAAETYYWLELCAGAGIGQIEPRAWLLDECDQLIAIFTASGRTAKQKLGK